MVYVRSGEAMLSVQKQWCEHMNRSVEREAFIDSGRIQGVELKSNLYSKF